MRGNKVRLLPALPLSRLRILNLKTLHLSTSFHPLSGPSNLNRTTPAAVPRPWRGRLHSVPLRLRQPLTHR
ncbi:hypothetical protein G7K_4373-t1 [Saitoella complicata NRRL Y-17804]|uniref:Uncharacterized protein n=1 Tax=Saitoella complicata (strain BCRC 22490 / CBS 7301 / JCM 7358 / NBRC 10748 / NRRL Y-17804) TaxID=698492 RepID=A0A0E9NKK8_SAICN|nr:hypothetical protein G7K_4373-t1 [Saitoella complicata NRRL Y-17804]